MTETVDVAQNTSCCASGTDRQGAAKQTWSFKRFPGRDYTLSPWAIVVTVPVLVLVLDQVQFVPFVSFAIQAFLGTLPYIAFAVLLIAWLKAAGAESYVGKAFEGRETQAIVLAALFGGLAPFCSCEVIPSLPVCWQSVLRCLQSWHSGCRRR
jgi:hypothetical protein